MAGEIVHVELPAEDADRAEFWNGLFGWSFQDSGMPGMDYRMAQASEQSGRRRLRRPRTAPAIRTTTSRRTTSTRAR